MHDYSRNVPYHKIEQCQKNRLFSEELFWLINLQYNSCFAAEVAFQFSTNNGAGLKTANESERQFSSQQDFFRSVVGKKMKHIFHCIKL